MNRGLTKQWVDPESTKALKIVVSSAMGALSDLVCTARALAFVAEEEDLGHSLAVCPTPPHNRQRLLLNRRVRSGCVSFPSLPSLSERSGFFFSELLDEPP